MLLSILSIFRTSEFLLHELKSEHLIFQFHNNWVLRCTFEPELLYDEIYYEYRFDGLFKLGVSETSEISAYKFLKYNWISRWHCQSRSKLHYLHYDSLEMTDKNIYTGLHTEVWQNERWKLQVYTLLQSQDNSASPVSISIFITNGPSYSLKYLVLAQRIHIHTLLAEQSGPWEGCVWVFCVSIPAVLF